MLAVQLKQTLLKNDNVDLILGYSCLKERRNNRTLHSLFCNVYYIDQNNDYKWNIIHFFFPGKALRNMLGGSQPKHYSDIYFWNPDWFFYYYYKYFRIVSHTVEWHVYGDAISQYFLDVPSIDPKFSEHDFIGRVLNRLDWMFWKVPQRNIEKLNYDFYMFQPSKFMRLSNRRHIAIPLIDANNKAEVDLLNKVFDYNYSQIDEKVIYIDTARDGQIDNNEVLQIIKKIQECVGTNELIVKPHPRVELGIYDTLDLAFLDKNTPCELFFLNGGLKNKVLICQFSSAVCLSYLWFGFISDLISTIKIVGSSSKDNEIFLEILKMIQSETNRVFIPDNEVEMINEIDKVTKKEKGKRKE